MKRLIKTTTLLTSGVALLLASTSSHAVGTRRFELKTESDLKGGDLEGVAVDATGRVRAGFSLGETPIAEGNTIWSALALDDGTLLIGTGNEGKILSYKGGKVEVAAETKSLVVTSLAKAWGGSVAVGTLPDGEVMKLTRGKLEKLAKLEGAEHVWQVAFDAKTKALFAATGPEGKLFRIDAAGKAQVYFDAEEQHLMSVAVAKDGTVYAGSSDEAKLYKLTGPGRAAVVHDFDRTEVRAVAVADDGTVYAIANDINSSNLAPKRKTAGGEAQPVTGSSNVKGKGTLYRFSPEGTPEQLLDDTSEHFVSLALGDDGKPYVGTGAEGRVYTIDDLRNQVLIADTKERQIGALVMAGKRRFVAASDPAVLHPVRGVGGADAVWTSKILDAGIRARYGQLSWVADGQLELSTRTGNTKKPDDTWSAWSAPLVRASAVTSPPARYFQVRARFNRNRDAVLNEVHIPFVTDNLRAVVTEVDVSGKSNVTTGVSESGGPVTSKANSKMSLSWKVNNPDKDELRYKLEYRLVGTTAWYDMLEPRQRLTKTTYSWETADLPEGRYRVRVVASDELSNPPDRVTSHELVSNVVLVDNTAPSIVDLQAVGRKVRGTVVDGVGPIARIEVSVSGTEEWFPFYPRDGIFDEQREEFEADVSTIAPAGRVMLTVRVYDEANNFVVRHVTLR